MIDVVFIPGFLCDERLFSDQIETLRAHPGVSSVMVADISDATSVPAMAHAVLEQAPDSFVAIGLSLGAIVATDVISMASERVRAVALFDTNLAAPGERQLEQRRRWDDQVRRGQMATVVANELVGPLTIDPPAHRAVIEAMAARAGASTFLGQNHALLHRRDRRHDLRHLRVPVLVACGEADALCPPDVHRDLVALIPGAELAVVPAAGHLATIDQPAVTSSLLADWIHRVERATLQPPPQQTGGNHHEYTSA
ncbi:alpha/beta fold hydrolase [soil metagenome]